MPRASRVSVQGFATGPDGGRDARFEGTAQLHPSVSEPWKGRVVIQAKHTNGLNKSFTESEFYGATSKTSVVAGEMPRITSLKNSGELDHYMLFSNRRLPGNGESEIRRLYPRIAEFPLVLYIFAGLSRSSFGSSDSEASLRSRVSIPLTPHLSSARRT